MGLFKRPVWFNKYDTYDHYHDKKIFIDDGVNIYITHEGNKYNAAPHSLILECYYHKLSGWASYYDCLYTPFPELAAARQRLGKWNSSPIYRIVLNHKNTPREDDVVFAGTWDEAAAYLATIGDDIERERMNGDGDYVLFETENYNGTITKCLSNIELVGLFREGHDKIPALPKDSEYNLRYKYIKQNG